MSSSPTSTPPCGHKVYNHRDTSSQNSWEKSLVLEIIYWEGIIDPRERGPVKLLLLLLRCGPLKAVKLINCVRSSTDRRTKLVPVCVCFLQGQTGPSAPTAVPLIAFPLLLLLVCTNTCKQNRKEESQRERLPVYLSVGQRKIAANKVFIKQIFLRLTIKLGFTEGTSLTFHTLHSDLQKVKQKYKKNCKLETSQFEERCPHWKRWSEVVKVTEDCKWNWKAKFFQQQQ